MGLKAVLVLACVAGSLAVPMRREVQTTCARSCRDDLNKFKYEKGKTYQFSYEADTTTQIQGSMEEQSGLHAKATVEIEVVDKCEMTLKVKQVRLEQSDPANFHSRTPVTDDRFARLVEANPLRFAFQDGEVESLCPVEGEDVKALNFKRGILSAFQNTMDDFEKGKTTKEADVAGNCNTVYTLTSKGWSTYTINKTKDILGCTDRHGHLSSVQATDYRASSDIQSMPLMKTWHSCEQEIHNSGRLSKTSCIEKHVFRPFSKYESGAVTVTSSKMEYVTDRYGVSSASDYARRTDLLFEHQFEMPTGSRDSRQAEATFTTICQKSEEEIKPEVAQLFAQLVYNLRELDESTLRRVFGKLDTICSSNTDKAKKFFIDAMVAVGSTGSVQAMQRLIADNEVNGMTAEIWLTSLAFIQQPTKEMLVALKPLLERSTLSRKAFLSISTLVHSYCLSNAQCDEETAVLDILKVFETSLARDCSGDREKTLMALKALGNAGILTKAIPTLQRCFQNKNLDMEIRVEATKAFRRMPCGADRDGLLNTFKTTEEETEIRIASFLALMKCPTDNIIRDVKETLEKEEVNQVGSFVWTYLTNLMETGSLYKQEIRKILEDETLKKEFNLDMRKFSRNIEKSFFFEMLNAGATAESNLIWSPKSYIPRSGMFNLTVDLFGKSMNLLELDGRVEGMEYMLENFFGPNGYFKDNAVSDLLKRNRRNLKNTVNVLGNTFEADAEDDMKGSMSLKVFGNEIRYMDLANFKSMDFNFLEILQKLSEEHNYDYTTSMMFLDSTMNVPTIVGFPLKLSVNGTATISVQVGGKVDLRQLGKAPRSMDINGHIKPSGAIEISSMMSIEAVSARAGVKMVNTLSSSAVVQGKMQIEDGRVFLTSIDMPKDQIDLFDVKTKFFVVGLNSEREQKMITDDRIEQEQCTGKRVEKLLGIQLCGKVSLPNAMAKSDAPFFPLTGPLHMKVALNKKDTMTGYQFQASYELPKVHKGGRRITNFKSKLSFNTPGSRVNREISSELAILRSELAASYVLKSPWKTISINGDFTNRENLKRMVTRMTNDDVQYSMTSELKIEKNLPRKIKYTPSVEIVIPNRDTITLEGGMEYIRGKKLEGEAKLMNLLAEPVTFKANLEKTERPKRTSISHYLELKSTLIQLKTTGNYDIKQKSLSSRVEMQYALRSAPTETFALHGKINDRSAAALDDYSADLAFESSQFSDYNFQVKTNGKKGSKHVSGEMEFSYGRDPADAKRKISITQDFNDVSKGGMTDLNGKVTLKFPLMRVDTEASFNHKHNKDTLNSNAVAKYNNKEARASLNLEKEMEGQLKLKGDANLRIPNRHMRLYADVEEKSQAEFHSKMIAQWDFGKKAEMDSLYERKGRVNHEVSSTITIVNMSPIKIDGKVSLQRRAPSMSGSVEYDGKSYSTAASAEIRKNAINGEATVKYPERTLKTEATYGVVGSKRHADFAFKWDADRDESKVLTLGGDYEDKTTNAMFHHEASLKFNHPMKRGEVEVLLHKTDGDGKAMMKTTWDQTNEILLGGGYSNELKYGNRRLKADVKLTTPFRKYRSMAGSITQEIKRGEYTTHAEASWEPRKKVEADFSLKHGAQPFTDLETTLTMSTPFQSLERFSGKLMHKMANGQLASSVSTEWGRKKMEMTASGNARSLRDFEGKIVFTSPFTNAERVILTGVHNCQTSRIKSTWEAQVVEKKFGIDLDMNHQIALPSLNTKGTLTITTPIQHYSTNTISWDHRNTDSSIQSKLEGMWHHEKVIFNIKGDHTVGYRRALKGSVELQTTMEPVRHIILSLDHENGDMDFKTTTELTSSHHRLFLGSSEFKLEEKTVSANAQLITPWMYVENIRAKVEGDISKMPYSGSVQLDYAPSKRIAVESTMDYRGTWQGRHRINGNLRFTSPFKPVETVVLSVDHQCNAGWQSEVTLTYDVPEKKVHLSTNLRNADDILATVSLKTPFEEYPAFNAKFNHKTPGEGMWETEANVEYLPGKNIDFKSELVLADSFKGSMTFKTPFTPVKNIQASFSHEGEPLNFRSSAELTHNLKNKFGVLADYEASYGFSNVKGSMTVMTPFKPVENVKLAFGHRGDLKDMKSNIELTYAPSKKMETILIFKNAQTIEAKLVVKSPFDNFENMAITFNHAGRLIQFQTEAALTTSYPGWQKFNIKVENDATRNIRSAVILQTPFNDYKSMSLEFTHRGQLSDFESKILAKSLPGNMQFSGEVSNRGTLSNFNAQMKITTPFRGYNEFAASATHRGRMLTDFESKVELTSAVRGFDKFAFQISNVGYLRKFNTRVETPFRGYDAFTIDVTNTEDLGNLQVTGKLVTPIRSLREFTIDLTNNGSPTDFTSGATITTPIRGFERFNIGVRHSGSKIVDFSSKLTMTLGFFGTGSIEASNVGILRNMRIKVITPLDAHREFNMEVNNNEDMSNLRANAKITTPYQSFREMSGEIKHSVTQQGFKSDVSLVTPFRNWERLSASVDHQLNKWNRIDSTWIVKRNNEEISLEMDHTMQQKDISSKVTLKTPIGNLAETSVELIHAGDIRDFESKMIIKTSIPRWEEMSAEVTHKGNLRKFTTTASLKTSLAKLRDMSFTITHDGNLRKFNTRANLKSQINGLRDVTATLSHEGNLRRFSTSGSVARHTFDISFDASTASLDLTIVLPVLRLEELKYVHKGPISSFTCDGSFKTYGELPEMSLKLNHNGNLRSFVSKGEINIPDKQFYEVSFTKSSMKLDAEVSLPILKIDSIKYTHNGPLARFTCSGSMQTGYSAFRDISMALEHNGDLSNFATKGELNIPEKQSFDVSYSNSNPQLNVEVMVPALKINKVQYTHDGPLNRFSCSGSLRTGIRGLRDISMKLDHNGGLRRFTTKGELNLPQKQAFEITLNTINPRLNLDVSLPALKVNKIQYTHQGPLARFTGSGSLNTEFMDDISISMEHNYRLQAFNTKGSLNYKGEQSLEISFDKPTKTVDIKLQVPALKLDSFVFHHEGYIRRFTTTAKLRYGLEDVEIALNHNGNRARFNSKIEVKLPEVQSLDIKFNSANNKLNINLQAPALKVKSVEFKHNGPISKFNTLLNAETDYAGYQNLGLTLSNDGNLNAFDASAVLELPQRQNLRLTWNKASSKIHLDASIPAAKISTIEVRHEGNLRRFSTSGNLRSAYNGLKNVGIHCDHDGFPRRFNSKCTLRLPEEQSIAVNFNKQAKTFNFEAKLPVASTSATLSHTGGLSKFETKMNVEDKWSLEAEHDRDQKSALRVKTPINNFEEMSAEVTHIIALPKIDITSELRTSHPRVPSITAELHHHGVLQRFNTEVKLTTPFRNMESQSVRVEYTGQPKDFEGKVVVATRIPNYESITYEVKHQGNLRSFKSSASLEYGNYKKIEGAINMKLNRLAQAQGSISLKSPIPNFDDLSLSFRNTFQGRQGSMSHASSVSWAQGKKISLDATYNGESGNMKLTTPFEDLREIALDLTGKFQPWNMNMQANAHYNGEKWVSVDSAYSATAHHIGRMKLNTLWAPLRQASVDFDGKFDLSDMSLQTEIQHNDRKWVDGEMTYNKKNQNRHVGRFTLRQPLQMSHNFNVLYAPRQIDGAATINWNTRRQNSKIQMNLDVQDRRYKKELILKAVLPSRTIGLSTTTESRNGLSHKSELTWDEAKSRKVAFEFNQEGDNYDAKLTTPIRSLAMKLDKSKSYRSQKIEGELMWDADRDQSKKLTLKGQMNQLPDGATIITTIQHPMLRRDITISSELRMNASPMYSGKLEVEYAPEQNKKLTLSSKVGNIGTNNYTVEFEISHPESGVDISMAANAGDENGRMTGNFLYRYQDESVALMSEINKIRKELRSQMLGSYSWMTPWLMEGKMNTKRDGYSFELKNTYERTRHGHPHSINTIVDINTETPAFELKSTGAHDLIYSHIFAKYPNSSAFQLKAMHDMGEGPVDDAEIFINLIGNHLFHEKFYLRLAMKDDLKAYFERVKNYYAEKRREYMQSTTSVYTPELASLKEEMEPLIRYMSGELSSFERDYNTVKQELNQMSRRNEFFMRDIGLTAVLALTKLSEKMAELEQMYVEIRAKMTVKLNELSLEMDRIRRETLEVLSTLKVNGIEKYSEMMEEMKTKYEALRAEMMEFYKEQAMKFGEKMKPFIEKYNEYQRQAMAKVDHHVQKLNQKVQHYIEQARAHPYYSKIFDFHDKSMASIREAINSRDLAKPLRDLHVNARDMLAGLHQVASENYDLLSNKYANAIYQARDSINAKIDQVLSHPQVTYARDMGHDMVNKGMEYYRYYKLEENVKHHLQNMYDSARLMGEKQWQTFLHDYLQINRTRIIRYDPREFILEFEVFNPIPMKDLLAMPELNLDVYRDRLDAMVKKYTPKDDMSLWDLYYTYKPSPDPRDWVPPFKAHATLIGRQHFMTFDHKHFEYAGKCSYILAKDFIDGNFTAIVNYDGTRDASRKSITVLSDDKSIEIAPDFTVRVGSNGGNAKKEELPFEFQSTTVRRQGDLVRIDNSNGVTIMCNWAHDVCTLNMTGWYFGKTAGLFGTYDNEMTNDFLTSEKKLTENTGDFAYSWKVQPRCNSRHNLARSVPAVEGTEEYNKCAALFKEKAYSPYRYCFKQVDPQPYFEMCVNDMTEKRKTNALCSVSAGYVQDCARHGVNLRLESACVKCDYNRISKTEGESFTLSATGDAKVPKTADVIFVIEEKSCNKEFNFKLLTRTMEKDMKQQGLKSIKFGIVGYGGAGVHDHEHQHTIQGELLGHAHDIASTSLTFLNNGKNSDALRAVDLAARYPFRPGSSKTIILVPCSSCKKMSVDYSDIQSLLVPSGIKFHVLMQHEFQLKSNRRSPKTNYIFGVDGNTAFTSKTSDIQGDKTLFQQIAIPKDLCVALALETNGSVFNSLKLEQGRWSDKKLFADSVAQRVASTAQPADCQVCECRKDDQGVGVNVCRRCGVTSEDTFKLSEMFLDSYNFNKELEDYLTR